MSIQFLCDICGMPIDIRGKKHAHVQLQGPTATKYVHYDVCGDCFSGIKAYFNGKGEEAQSDAQQAE